MPSPSFLAVADVHIGLNLYNQPELGADLNRLFSEICKLAVTLRVNYLVIVGDLYDSNKPTPNLIRFVRTQIEEARLGEVKVVGIAGDHDKPISSVSWTNISGVAPIDSVAQFVGHDYSDDPNEVIDYLKKAPHSSTAEWLFLHAQVPSLWPFCSERKKIDFSTIPVFQLFPKLRGIILGDIHKPFEGKLIEKDGREAFVGYCGSVGITASNDIDTKRGLLHFDGIQLKRVPLPLGRDFIKIDMTTNSTTGLEISYYVDKYSKHRGRRPVFIVEYALATKDRLKELRPLYQLGHVRTFQQRVKEVAGGFNAVNIRSDLKNHERIDGVLAGLVSDEEVKTLLQAALHTEDPKLILDAFRENYFAKVA